MIRIPGPARAGRSAAPAHVKCVRDFPAHSLTPTNFLPAVPGATFRLRLTPACTSLCRRSPGRADVKSARLVPAHPLTPTNFLPAVPGATFRLRLTPACTSVCRRSPGRADVKSARLVPVHPIGNQIGLPAWHLRHSIGKVPTGHFLISAPPSGLGQPIGNSAPALVDQLPERSADTHVGQFVRILLILLVLWLLWRWVKRALKRIRDRGQSASLSTPDDTATEMAPCAYCGVHVPKQLAVNRAGKTYCSHEHNLAARSREPQ